MSGTQAERDAIKFLQCFEATWSDDVMLQLLDAKNVDNTIVEPVKRQTMYTILIKSQVLLFDKESEVYEVFNLLGLEEGTDYEIERTDLRPLYFQEESQGDYMEISTKYGMIDAPRPAFMEGQKSIDMSWPLPFNSAPSITVPDDFNPKAADGFPQDGYPVVYLPSSVQPTSCGKQDDRFVREGRPVFDPPVESTANWWDSLESRQFHDKLWYGAMSANGRREDENLVRVTHLLGAYYAPSDYEGSSSDTFLPKRWKEARTGLDDIFWRTSARSYDFFVNGLDTSYLDYNLRSPSGRIAMRYHYPFIRGGYFPISHLHYNPNAILHLAEYKGYLFNWAKLDIKPYRHSYLGRSQLPLFEAPGKKTWGKKKNPSMPVPLGQRAVTMVRFLRNVVLWW